MYFEIGGKMPLGKIKWFDSKKGYGFIKEDKTDPDWLKSVLRDGGSDYDKLLDVKFNIASKFFLNFGLNQAKLMEPLFRKRMECLKVVALGRIPPMT